MEPTAIEERIRLLEAALVECFDAAIPQAMPWTGTFSEKAAYAAKILAEHIRGLMRLHAAQANREFAEDLVAVCTKHGAVLFPRKDSERMYVSAEVGETDPVWLDFLRISKDGAEQYPAVPKHPAGVQ